MVRGTQYIVLSFFVLSVLISILLNDVDALSVIVGLRRLFPLIILSFIIKNSNLNSNDVARFYKILLFTLSIQPTIAVLEFLSYTMGLNPGDVSLVDSAIGTFSKKNGTATIAIFIIFLALKNFHETRRLVSPYNGYLFLAFFLGFSGGSYYLLFMSIIILSMLFPKVITNSRRLQLVIFTFITAIILFQTSEYSRRFVDFGNAIKSQSEFWQDAGRFGDIAAIQTVYSDISKDRFTQLFGVGPGRYSENRVSEKSSKWVNKYNLIDSIPTNENALAMLLAEYGILGTLLYTYLLLTVLIHVYKLYDQLLSRQAKYIAFAYVGFALIYILGMPYRNYIFSLPESFFFWILPVILPGLDYYYSHFGPANVKL